LVRACKKNSVSAASALLDRGWGRPAQTIDMRALFQRRLSELTNEELASLEEALTAMGEIPEDEPSSNDR
jgi:hypothetical protein